MLRFITRCAAALLIAGTASAADTADNFPSKPITIIVGVAPGGTLDTLARLIGNELSKVLKQTVVVENTAGAGGLIGMQRLLKSDPDGHTLMFSNMSLAIIPLLHPKAGVDVVRDLQTIGTVGTVPMVLSVSNKSGIQDLPDMLKRMREPGAAKLNLGSGGPGSTAHLAEAMFLNFAQAPGELIPYRGTGPALTDLMSGMIDAIIDQTVTMLPLHADKRVKAIAVTGNRRLPQNPDIPTFAEGGLPQFDLAIWNALVAPKDTPAPVMEKLAAALQQVVDSPEFRKRLDDMAAQVPPDAERGPKGLATILQRDVDRVSKLVKEANLLSGN